MEKQNDILNELKSWNSPLADMPRTMPFAVPDGYFESLYENIQAGIRMEKEYPLPEWKEMPYEVPQGYFETLPEVILDRIHIEEITLPKETPLIAPEGYFEQLPMQILQAAKESDKVQPAKVIPLRRKVLKSVRWAAAAILLLAVGFGSYRAFNPSVTATANQELSQLSQEEISNYVQQHIDEFETDLIVNTIATNKDLPLFSEEEIIEYLDETGWEETGTN